MLKKSGELGDNRACFERYVLYFRPHRNYPSFLELIARVEVMKNHNNSMAYIKSSLLVGALAFGLPYSISAQEPLHIGYAAQVERNVEGQLGTQVQLPTAQSAGFTKNRIHGSAKCAIGSRRQS